MTVTTSNAADILCSVARCIEAGSHPARNSGSNPAWKEHATGDLENAAHRHFDVFISSIEDLDNNGFDGQTSTVNREMRFAVRLKFRLEGKSAMSSNHGEAERDTRSISDRVQRQIREHNYAYSAPTVSAPTGTASATALNGVQEVKSDGPTVFIPGGDTTTVFAVIPFLCEFTDLQVTT